MDEKLWTLEDVADFSQLAVSTIRRYESEGRIKRCNTGGAIRFKPEDIREYFSPDKKEN